MSPSRPAEELNREFIPRESQRASEESNLESFETDFASSEELNRELILFQSLLASEELDLEIIALRLVSQVQKS